MTEYTVGGAIDKGRLKIRNVPQFEAALKSFKDGEVFITIERVHAKVSEPQRGYLFGVVLHMLAEETGHSVKELHEWAKAKFLPHEVAICDGNGEVVDDLVGSITKLNRTQMYEFTEEIRLFMAERLGIVTPDPDPAWKEERAAKQATKVARGQAWAAERRAKSLSA